MSAWTPVSICGPALLSTLGLCGLILTLKISKILRNIFLLQDHLVKDSWGSVSSKFPYTKILKRILPLYGACTYTTIQFEVPPAVQIYLLIWHLMVLWAISMTLGLFTESFSPLASLLSALASTILSVAICLLLHNSFIESFNQRPRGGPNAMSSEKIEISFTEDKLVSSSKPLRETANSGKSLEFQLTLSGMFLGMAGLWSVFALQAASDEIIEGGFYHFILGLALDLPLRLGIGCGLRPCRLISRYEEKYIELRVEMSPRDLANYRRTPADDNTRQMNDSSDNPHPLALHKSPERSPLKLSPIKEDPYESPNARDEASQRTVASHNEDSIEEMFLTPQKFFDAPQPQEGLHHISPSPQKHSSPLKQPGTRQDFEGESSNQPNYTQNIEDPSETIPEFQVFNESFNFILSPKVKDFSTGKDHNSYRTLGRTSYTAHENRCIEGAPGIRDRRNSAVGQPPEYKRRVMKREYPGENRVRRSAYSTRASNRKGNRTCYKVYHQDLTSAFRDRDFFREEEVKLDDRLFVKNQVKKMASISEVYR